ncbi:flagellar biosynthesis protein FlhF [Neobacillus jeddahensis]|uniref:flagellar biosynthesis protein FlhF n=1 Tax=Neobacillus jeddahensis TaxID=1461580 RepID=UPI00059147C8|nr:flagellar biosynthesis protein FlhF [Neobacillus jeddahensis]
MKTKKIIAETMPLALKMVRQQLGDNAIIVNTRTIKTGGLFGLFTKQKYEVTAYSVDKEQANPEPPTFAKELKEKIELNYLEKQVSITPKEEEPTNSGFHKKPQQLYQYYSQTPADIDKAAVEPAKPAREPVRSVIEPTRPVLEPARGTGNDETLLNEIKHMRKMMMNFMMNEQQENHLPPGLTKWVNRMKQQGVNADIIEHMVNAVLKKHESIQDLDDNVIKQEVFSIVTNMFEMRIVKNNTVEEQTRMINVIGPTGVGKTTSIAKLATEQVLKQKRRVAMITTDVYRIAAVEQLKTYAAILNVPIEVVRSANELESTLKKLEHYDLIYMDTTGRNYKEIKNRETIHEFIHHPIKSENYLVLSLTTKYEDLQLLLNEFLDSPIQKLILTKFDETSSYGSILNIAYQYPYQLAYITNGQSVPEDIIPIDAGMLTRYLLGEDQ